MLKFFLIFMCFAIFIHQKNAYSLGKWDYLGTNISISKDLFISTRSIKGDLYIKDVKQIKDLVIISPGGGIKSKHITSLSKEIAEYGNAVFTIDYPFGYAILYRNLFDHLKEMIQKKSFFIHDIQENDIDQIRATFNSFAIFGHSLGGAILGDVIKKEEGIISKIILYGVDKFTSKINVSNKKVIFLSGENDRLINFKKVVSMASESKNWSANKIEGLNHFCILDNNKIGSRLLRNKDGKTRLENKICAKRLAEIIETKLGE